MDKRPYKVVFALDTETSNVCTLQETYAFPCLYQLGRLNVPVETVTAGNVEDVATVELIRHCDELYTQLDMIISEHKEAEYIPVCSVHNLGFDMYALAPWLNQHKTSVIAKSSTKPITITVLDRETDAPLLVFWDTLGLAQKSLEIAGRECGYDKLVGAWDYDLVRTPETPLTPDEIAYATHDIYALFSWLGYFLRLNPTVTPDELGRKVVTKTGVVRVKREKAFSHLKAGKQTVGKYWLMQAKTQEPKSDDELYTQHASTRGGLVFAASKYAGVPFELVGFEVVAGFDAASQHPAQMTSHFFPVGFQPATPRMLEIDTRLVAFKTPDQVLESWERPFPVAFCACIEVEGLRLKSGSIFERDGIATLASARLGNVPFYPEDNLASAEFREGLRAKGYRDTAEGAFCCFGKVERAERIRLFVTEIEWWIINQVYELDYYRCLYGYETGRFVRPTDYCVLSVMRFFSAKDKFKSQMHGRADYDVLKTIAPEYLARAMADGTAEVEEVKNYYQYLKSDLNALYGIEITNEARPSQRIDPEKGIVNDEGRGLEDMPNHPKTWYYFGQRIVAWSRLAQIVNMQLMAPYAKAIVNGDTDSIKALIDTRDMPAIKRALDRYAKAVAKARKSVCYRVEKSFPDEYNPLDGMGAYELEFTTRQYMSAWNKSYIIADEDGAQFTLAGLPTSTTSHRPHGLDGMYDALRDAGMSFGDAAGLLLGYNVTVDASITRLNGRKVPPWGVRCKKTIVDYMGNAALVDEPYMVALYPEPKVIGSTETRDNAVNARIAKRNNPEVNTAPVLFLWDNGYHVIRED